MRVQRALVLKERKGELEVVDNWPLETPNRGEILIQNVCVGLNPIDWKSVMYDFGIHSLPWINGREGAGIVVELGEGVTEFDIGDRVFVTSTNYRDVRTSTFQTFSLARVENVGKLPNSIDFERGAAIGVGLVTAGVILYDTLDLDLKKNCINDQWLLVWGGSTIVGIFTTQLAKYSGFKVAAVSSLHNADYLHSIGADIVLDRHDVKSTIATAQSLNISVVIDCAGAESAGYGASILSPEGKLICVVKKPVTSRDDISILSIRLKRFHEDLDFGNHLILFASNLLDAGHLIPPRTENITGGLKSISQGLGILQANKVSGFRVVVRLDDHA